MNLLNKLLSLGENRTINRYRREVDKINALEPEIQAMSDQAIIDEAKSIRRPEGTIDDLSAEERIRALALVREHVLRVYKQRAYDVQLMAALALNEGHVAESKTGEGKTCNSRMTIFINVLAGRQVHVITVNEYLAKRDATECRKCLGDLGITVGYIFNQQSKESKRKAYACDVVYGTPSEFGFDYLRDNMATSLEDKVQLRRDFAIIDEADSIMIDEARTPLIISGGGIRTADTYYKFASIVPSLREGVDFDMDEKKKLIACTEVGLAKVESMLGIDDLYADPTGMYPSHLQCALKAQFLFHRDKDYIVTGGEVKIVDEFTGRIMEGRRWSEGLHQAIEAKEHVRVQEENQTLATITLQNFFRLYDKLAGMTGTAITEDAEFRKTYKMGVVVIPTNKPVIRIDEDDLVYRTIDSKFNAIADEIEERHSKGQPILVGTVSVEMSEKLSRLLDKRGIQHATLNAKFHEYEAGIVAQAGRQGAVTIATNMAGRGTDIILGGNPEGLYEQARAEIIAQIEEQAVDPETGEHVQVIIPDALFEQVRQAIEEQCAEEQKAVLEAGGLCVLGTERHDSRRIDNQLRGRSGRQGDPGFSQFYISLEDDLMRLFGKEKMERISQYMETAQLPDDVPIQAKMVTKAIENAQHTVEGVNAEMRKHVLEYDDVMNLQRKAIYGERDYILEHEDVSDMVQEIMDKTAERGVLNFCNPSLASDDWDWEGLRLWYMDMMGLDEEDIEWLSPENQEVQDDVSALTEAIEGEIHASYDEKRELLGDFMTDLERQLMLKVLDSKWMDHLAYMDHIRHGIGLRAYGQKEPLVEYKEEAFNAFSNLVQDMFSDYIKTLLRMKVAVTDEPVLPEGANILDGAEYSQPNAPAGSVSRDIEKLKQSPYAGPPIGEAPFAVTFVDDRALGDDSPAGDAGLPGGGHEYRV